MNERGLSQVYRYWHAGRSDGKAVERSFEYLAAYHQPRVILRNGPRILQAMATVNQEIQRETAVTAQEGQP